MKISVITVLYNAEETIKECLNSVKNQTYDNLEYIVIDGNSTDGSVDIINEYNDVIDYFISENDLGIYDAYNKALKKVTGDWVFFLNADDKFSNANILENVSKKMTLPECDLYYGNIIYDNGVVFNSAFNRKLLWKNTLHHQSAFYNRKLFFNKEYSLNNSVLSDYLFHLELYMMEVKTHYIDETITICGSEGVTKQFKYAFYLEESKMKFTFFKKFRYVFVYIFPLLKYVVRKLKIYK